MSRHNVRSTEASKAIGTFDQAELRKWTQFRTGLAVDMVPAGWYTVNQAAERLNTSVTSVRRMLCKAGSSGKLETKRFRIKTKSRIILADHFHIKD